MPFVNLAYNSELASHDAEKFSIEQAKQDGAKISVVDQFDSQPFLHGDNGFNRNIISQIMAAESEDLRQYLLQRIGKDASYGGFDPKTPANEVIESVMPRNVQTSSSCRDWIASHDKTIKKYSEDLQKQYDDIRKKEHIVTSTSVDDDIVDKV